MRCSGAPHHVHGVVASVVDQLHGIAPGILHFAVDDELRQRVRLGLFVDDDLVGRDVMRAVVGSGW